MSGLFSLVRILFYPDKAFIRKLRKILGFFPHNPKYYELALTHKSAPLLVNKKVQSNNERLEFLGDAVLDLAVSAYLYKKFPNVDEGFLTQLRSKIVNGKKLTELAKHIKLQKLVHANIGKNTTGRIYEDAFEALIGAIYLDRGFKCVETFISQKIIGNHINLDALIKEETNFKSKFIEWAQKYKVNADFFTDYESLDSKYFISYIRIENEIAGQGRGISKKIAEQNAAQNTLENLEKDNKIQPDW